MRARVRGRAMSRRGRRSGRGSMLASLGSADRDAVLLRYVQGKSHRAVADALGTSEDGARKRVDRAVDRLRRFFRGRGVTLSVAGLAGMLSTNAVQAAPAGLAAGVSSAALASVG